MGRHGHGRGAQFKVTVNRNQQQWTLFGVSERSVCWTGPVRRESATAYSFITPPSPSTQLSLINPLSVDRTATRFSPPERILDKL
ncbi:hypothetical protein J6590_021582 [Homalodisca vitripennis]|nr:hypothetical protein J6590_021582 [Homalodisca vitripennis]